MFWQMPVMSAVARELARQVLLDGGRTADADTLAWDPTLARFPHPEMTTLSLTGRVIAPCIFAACMFGAVSQMAQLVAEKDSGLRQAMRTMGLLESSYWGSWVVFDMVFATVLTLVIIFSGESGLVLLLGCLAAAAAAAAAGAGAAAVQNEQRSSRQRGTQSLIALLCSTTHTRTRRHGSAVQVLPSQ